MSTQGSLRAWLLRHLALIALAPAVAFALTVPVLVLPALQHHVETDTRIATLELGAQLGTLLQEPVEALERLATTIERESDPLQPPRIPDGAHASPPGFEAIYLTDREGRLLAASPPDRGPTAWVTGAEPSAVPVIRAALERRRPVWGDPAASNAAGRVSVPIAVARDHFVLAAEASLPPVEALAQRIGTAHPVSVLILDSQDRLVSSSDPRFGPLQIDRAMRVATAPEPAPTRRIEFDGLGWIASSTRIAGPGWQLIVLQPLALDRLPIQHPLIAFGVTLLIIGLLGWALAVRLAGRLADPLAALVGHAESVSRGNYETPSPQTPWPDLDRLRIAMDKMVNSIVLRERALLATEDRYRSLVNGIDDLIAQFDLNGIVQFSNPASEHFLGLRPGACLGISLYEVVQPDDRERTRRAISEWLDSEDWQLAIETRMSVSDRPPTRALWALAKDFNDRGDLVGFRGIARDVTEMRRGQDALRGLIAATARESGEEFFRLLVLHMARTLDADSAVVAQRQPDAAEMQTLAVWSNKSFAENFRFPITATPCERLLHAESGVLAEAIGAEDCPEPLKRRGEAEGFLGAALRDSHGNRVGVLFVLAPRDLSGRADLAQLVSIFADRAAMELIRQRSEAGLRLAASVFQNSAEGIVITDPDHCIISANAACLPITGYSPAELVGHTPRLLRSGRHGAEFYEQLNAALAQHGQWTGEVWNRRKDGRVYPQWMTVTEVRDPRGQVANYISSFFDISARKEAEARIHFLAHHDALTGLPNRVLLQDRLIQAISYARRERRRVGLMFLDLDRFKLINDSLGHDVGDALLEQVAGRLSEALREGETVARLGGDEFVVVLPNLAHSEDASLIAGRLLHEIGRPIEIRGQSFHVNSSIGISVFPDDGENVETLLRNADTAMYHAKELGRGNFQFYTETLNAIVTERVHLENDMRRGLEQHEFVVHYQPQIDARSGQVVGAEALVRWRHPEQGIIAPARFIPVAEDTGLIVPLGEFVLIEACRQAVAWNRRLHLPIRMGVNLSARQFAMSNLVDTIKWALETTGMEPAQLELELTESMLMEHPESAAAQLQQLSALGVRLAIDDFGTGYSSLSYLRRFEIDRLKVDQSFIQDLSSDPNDAAIVRAVITLAHTLNLEVIAEGVETREHLAQLQAWGCFDVQGFLFSKPLAAPDFETFYADNAAAVAVGPGSCLRQG